MGGGGRGRWQQRFGVAAEEHACGVLRRSGYTIIRRRYRAAGGEIDIAAARADRLLVVEVKARRHTKFGCPAEAVTLAKQRRIVAATRALMRETGPWRQVRFDVFALLSRAGVVEVEWLRDAFRP